MGTMTGIACATAWAIVFLWTILSIRGKWASKKNLAINLGTIAVTLVVFRFIAPRALHFLVYEGLFAHLFQGIAIFFAMYLAVVGIDALTDEEVKGYALPISYGIAAAALAFLGIWGVNVESQFRLAHSVPIRERSEPIEVSVDMPTFTPREVAFAEMINDFGHASYSLEHDLVDAIDLDEGMGYIVPISPEGVYNWFTKPNRGYQIYDDRVKTADRDRVYEDTITQRYGEDMFVWNDVQVKLYSRDPFAVYPEVHYAHLEGKIVAVCPRLRFKYVAPISVIPYWDGCSLVWNDGRIEDKTVAQLKSDPRLHGKFIYPLQFYREIIEAQAWRSGPLAGIFKPEGRIRVPELETENQPFPFQGADNERYYVLAVEPDGKSFALMGLYYINAATGEITYKKYSTEARLKGIEAVIPYIKSQLSGMKWVEHTKDGTTGDYQIIPGIPIPRPNGEIYWKATVSAWDKKRERLTGIALTVVVNSRDTTVIKTFYGRSAFVNWLKGSSSQSGQQVSPQEILQQQENIKRARRLLEDGLRLLPSN